MTVVEYKGNLGPSRRITLRNWWTAAFGIVVSVFFLLFWLAWALEEASGPGPVGGVSMWFLSLFFPLVWWFLLKASFFTNIRIEGGEVVVRNLFDKTVIPVGQISSVAWKGGVDIITRSGEKYWCFNLGGSLLGAISGYPTNRRCAQQIELFVEEKKGGDSGIEDSRVMTFPHLNLAFLVVASLSSFASLHALSLLY